MKGWFWYHWNDLRLIVPDFFFREEVKKKANHTQISTYKNKELLPFSFFSQNHINHPLWNFLFVFLSQGLAMYFRLTTNSWWNSCVPHIWLVLLSLCSFPFLYFLLLPPSLFFLKKFFKRLSLVMSTGIALNFWPQLIILPQLLK